MNKPKRKNYRIEESVGDTPSESGLIIIHPYADLEGITECATEMHTPTLKRVHIIIDNRIPPRLIEMYLRGIMDAMPGLEYITKFTDPRAIALIGYLWHEMCDYCAKRSR